VEAAEKARVACLTTDFSMQNVLMQLGLKVLSVDGLLVKSVKQFVLRCMACYQVLEDYESLPTQCTCSIFKISVIVSMLHTGTFSNGSSVL